MYIFFPLHGGLCRGVEIPCVPTQAVGATGEEAMAVDRASVVTRAGLTIRYGGRSSQLVAGSSPDVAKDMVDLVGP